MSLKKKVTVILFPHLLVTWVKQLQLYPKIKKICRLNNIFFRILIQLLVRSDRFSVLLACTRLLFNAILHNNVVEKSCTRYINIYCKVNQNISYLLFYHVSQYIKSIFPSPGEQHPLIAVTQNRNSCVVGPQGIARKSTELKLCTMWPLADTIFTFILFRYSKILWCTSCRQCKYSIKFLC